MIPLADDNRGKDQALGKLGRVQERQKGSHDSRAVVVGPTVVGRYKLLVTPEEAAEILSVSRTRIYELVATGQLPSVCIGPSRRIPMVALEQFVQQLLDESRATRGEA
jgi:excisionase family DNA binding protein